MAGIDLPAWLDAADRLGIEMDRRAWLKLQALEQKIVSAYARLNKED